MVRKNIFANYIGAFLMVLAPVLALPCYLSILGPKQFGLISFVTTLQAFLGLLESGISQVSVREFSLRMNDTKDGRYNAAILLYGFERIYWLLATSAGLIILLLANVISSHWLSLGDEFAMLGKEAIYGAAIIFTVQFPGTLYRSLLAGAQAQVALNGIMVSGLLLRHIGGVILLIYWPTLLTYLIWQTIISLLETLVRARFAWKTLRIKRGEMRWNSEVLRPVWSAAIKMAGAVLLGALTTQLDKIILSRMVPIDQFGYYAIASTVAMGVLNMIYPLVQAISPRLMQSHTDLKTLRYLNIKLTKMIAIVVSFGAFCFLVFGEWFLKIWLKDPQTVAMVYPLLSILLIGSALNAFYHVGYFNWLATGNTNRILLVNELSIVLTLLSTPPLIAWKGMVGATFGFVAMNIIGLLISLEWIKRTNIAHTSRPH